MNQHRVSQLDHLYVSGSRCVWSVGPSQKGRIWLILILGRLRYLSSPGNWTYLFWLSSGICPKGVIFETWYAFTMLRDSIMSSIMLTNSIELIFVGSERYRGFLFCIKSTPVQSLIPHMTPWTLPKMISEYGWIWCSSVHIFPQNKLTFVSPLFKQSRRDIGLGGWQELRDRSFSLLALSHLGEQ